jgi:hypothetical protein
MTSEEIFDKLRDTFPALDWTVTEENHATFEGRDEHGSVIEIADHGAYATAKLIGAFPSRHQSVQSAIDWIET